MNYFLDPIWRYSWPAFSFHSFQSCNMPISLIMFELTIRLAYSIDWNSPGNWQCIYSTHLTILNLDQFIKYNHLALFLDDDVVLIITAKISTFWELWCQWKQIHFGLLPSCLTIYLFGPIILLTLIVAIIDQVQPQSPLIDSV